MFRAEKVRPVLPDKLADAVKRYAVAHNVSTTAAVALLLTAALKQQKFISDKEVSKI